MVLFMSSSILLKLSDKKFMNLIYTREKSKETKKFKFNLTVNSSCKIVSINNDLYTLNRRTTPIWIDSESCEIKFYSSSFNIYSDKVQGTVNVQFVK